MAKTVTKAADDARREEVAAEAEMLGKPGVTITHETGEVEGEAPAGIFLKLKRRVTIPQLKFPDGAKIVFTPIGAMHQGDALPEGVGTKADRDKGPVTLMPVRLMSGDVRVIVIGEVMRLELVKAFPGDSYVGAWLYVHKIAPQAGADGKMKRYATYDIVEIEPPDGAVADNTILRIA